MLSAFKYIDELFCCVIWVFTASARCKLLPSFIPLLSPPAAWIIAVAVIEPPTDTLLAKVLTPAILMLSKFVWPSTSISPPISKLPNVPTPTADTQHQREYHFLL